MHYRVQQQENEYLGQLIEPAEIPFGFSAPGWKVLALFIFVVLVFVSVWLFVRYIKNKYRRDALKYVAYIMAGEKLSDRIYYLTKLLKSMAIKLYGRERAAALHGRHWIEFLNSKTREPILDESNTQKIYNSLANRTIQISEFEEKQFVCEMEMWIRKHQLTNNNSQSTKTQITNGE